MKLRTMAMVVFSMGALALGGAGCKKKPKEGTPPPDKMGSAPVGSGSAGSGSAAAEPAKEAKLEGKGLADKYIECTNLVSGAKWDDFKSKCLAPDFKVHAADTPQAADADTAIGMMKDQRAAFPDMKLEPQLVLVNGRNILAVTLITGTHTAPLKGPMGELPPTNKKLGQLMFHRIAISDENRAAEEWAYYDPATMAAQLGVMPKDAPKMRPAIEKGLDGAPIVVVAADDAKEKANVEAFQKSTAAFMSKKSADYMAMYTDDAVEADQAGSQDWKGKKEIQAASETFLKAFPDLKMETPNVFGAGDYVVALGSFTGTNDGPLGPMKATKKKVTGEFAEVVQMKDGKIAQLWRFRNGLAMAMQLGLMPEPKAPPAGGGSGSAAAPAKGSADAPKVGSGASKAGSGSAK